MDIKCVLSKTQCFLELFVWTRKSFSGCLRFLETQVML